MRAANEFTSVDGQPRDYAEELEAQNKGWMHPIGDFVMSIVVFVLTLF